MSQIEFASAKPLVQSKTAWSAAIIVLAIVASFFGFDIGPVALVGAVGAILGRIVATKRIE